jgi:CHAT domain-containing protein
MVEFYQNLWVRKQGRLEALRSAQLALLDGRLRPKVDEAVRALGLPRPLPDEGKTAPTTRHPRYWSAFVLCGDWR